MEVFVQSLQQYVSSISIHTVILSVTMIFMLVGAVDRIRKNRHGYGEKFEEGFKAMGPLSLAMIGMLVLTPILRQLLEPVLTPVYQFFGASPAMFGGTLLACDMGGYPLAMQLAGPDEAIGQFSGILLGSMLGCTIVGSVPIELGILKKEDRPYFAYGIMVGMVTIPIGMLAGWAVMLFTGYPIGFVSMLKNLLPVLLIALLIILGLWKKPMAMLRGFTIFGKGLTALITLSLAAAVLQYETGLRFPLLWQMVEPGDSGVSPLIEALQIVGLIAIVLIGAFPMVEFITRHFSKALGVLGRKLGLDESGCAGMVASLANGIATFGLIEKMDPRSKLINIAFLVSASCVIGDHLGFTAGVSPGMIPAMIAGKLAAGVTAVILACAMAPMLLEKIGDQKS